MNRLPDHPWQISYGASDDRLNDFYIPALEASVRFDRTTGFFSSAALAIAAAGIVRLIENGGKMRLLCGAQLSVEDVEAVDRGADLKGVVEAAMVGCLADPTDQSMRARLEALAWLVAQGRLDIRVVLPRGPHGLPLPANEAREYYHPKEGVFEDAECNRLAFTGSGNDSANGWQWNYEVFNVYTTWPRRIGADEIPALLPFVNGVERRFQRLWEGKEDSWIALDIPKAAKDKLLTYTPDRVPTSDPLEKARANKANTAPAPVPAPEPTTEEIEEELHRERLTFRFLREAPFLPNADNLGVVTSAVAPWPHQLRIVQEVVRRYPANFMFCDEVGLGKTIEVGLALRQLIISERVKRVLILVPKSVMKQWQEELYEKFALNVPRYDGGLLCDVFDNEVPVSARGPWNSCPVLLAGSQLAKRKERQADLLAADPWDLVVVDEAHHARRRDFQDPRFRPNRLLELLEGAGGRKGLKERTSCIYLMTATPMQVNPVEVWDLLKVLGLGGRWGATEENFVRFFSELRKSASERDWAFVLSMVRDFLDAGGTIDPLFAETAERELGLVDWHTVRELPHSAKADTIVGQLNQKQTAFLHELARRHTPIRAFVRRNTRTLLRRYHEKGLLSENIPHRKPKNEWIALLDGPGSERELYDRIEEYISSFYQKYEAERRGLGFVMTVYRRRLTSSFRALELSLERRRDYLKGITKTGGGLTEDDVEQEDLDLDVTEEMSDTDRNRFTGELVYIEDFLHDLKNLGTDSKLDKLTSDLNSIFMRRDKVILFTQYADTMDYLRDQLLPVYGRQIACYSGRGGERWDGVAWRVCPKEEVKAAFLRHDDVKILLCTESASEGLNLQTCGVLINYDMPWNPMRVEQRIGRIDRIGQKYDEVWISNYFYEGTVEAVVYQRLEDRIGWFESVVGELQPILNRVAKTIQDLAMLTGKARKQRLDEEIASIREQLDAQELTGFDMDALLDDAVSAPGTGPAVVTMAQLEESLVWSRHFGNYFRPHDAIAGAYWLTWRGTEQAVTFKPAVFDEHPYTVAFLTYGNPLLAEMLASAPDPTGSGGPSGGIGVVSTQAAPKLSLVVYGDEQRATPVQTLPELQNVFVREEAAPYGAGTPDALLQERLDASILQMQQVAEERRKAAVLALREEARQILVRTALTYITEAQKPELFDDLSAFTFGTNAVTALKHRGRLYEALLKIASDDELAAEPTDPFFGPLQTLARDALLRKRESLESQGRDLARRYNALVTAPAPLRHGGALSTAWFALRQATTKSEENILPFVVLDLEEAKPFVNCVPLYDLKAAAGHFSEEQYVEQVSPGEMPNPEDFTWVQLSDHRPARDLFIAQIVGESMNRRIPNGAYCLFRFHPKGTRQGKVVLVEHRDIFDNELGGHYTVKVYDSTKQMDTDGSWTHQSITLKPDSNDPTFEPIVLDVEHDGELKIIAELVAVLG